MPLGFRHRCRGTRTRFSYDGSKGYVRNQRWQVEGEVKDLELNVREYLNPPSERMKMSNSRAAWKLQRREQQVMCDQDLSDRSLSGRGEHTVSLSSLAHAFPWLLLTCWSREIDRSLMQSQLFHYLLLAVLNFQNPTIFQTLTHVTRASPSAIGTPITKTAWSQQQKPAARGSSSGNFPS